MGVAFVSGIGGAIGVCGEGCVGTAAVGRGDTGLGVSVGIGTTPPAGAPAAAAPVGTGERDAGEPGTGATAGEEGTVGEATAVGSAGRFGRRES